MKLLHYVWRNVTRNRLRSTLTVLSVGFSMALMTVLHGYMVMQSAWGKIAQEHNRAVVMNTQGFSGKLPVAYVDRVRGVSGVVDAVPYSWFGGNYKDEQMPFAQFGTDANHLFNVYDEYKIDPEQLRAWQVDRQGCVADRRLVEKRGWKIGDKIPLKGTYYPVNLELVLLGVVDTPQYTDSVWFHWAYLDELLKALGATNAAGNAGTVFLKTTQKSEIAPVCQRIDERFASSDHPTRSQSEAAFAQMFTDMLGNIQGYIRNIGLAVVFSLSLVAANAMAMSMRERTTEIAVLKAIGFTRHRVLWLVLAESILIAFFGGVLGVLLGCVFLEGLHHLSAQFFPLPMSQLAGVWIAYLVSAAGAVGLVSGLFPALRASQLSVVDGLRYVA